jgi:hypothetical protein
MTDPVEFFTKDVDSLIARHRLENDIPLYAAIGVLRIAAALLECEASGGKVSVQVVMCDEEDGDNYV